MKTVARDRLLNAAGGLFYAHGVSGTGINAITDKAGVAKMSLYNNFSSKEELISAYVQSRHEALMRFYESRLEDALDPAGRVMAMFDAYLDHASWTMAADSAGVDCLTSPVSFLPATRSG